jgi:hypothetical protein
MAGDNSSPSVSLRERSFPLAGAEERLPKWITFSLIVHVGLALLIIIAPFTSSPRLPTTPIYTVDLVGGERIGRTSFGTELSGPAKNDVKAAEASAPIAVPKKEMRQEKAEKTKVAEKKIADDDHVLLRDKAKKEPAKKEPAKEFNDEDRAETASADSVRERLIKSAAARAEIVKRRGAKHGYRRGGGWIGVGSGWSWRPRDSQRDGLCHLSKSHAEHD